MKNYCIKICAFYLLFMLLAHDLSAQYCTGGGPLTTVDSNIESVSIIGENATSISYLSTCPGISGVDDQTGLTVDLIAGNTYTLDIQFKTCGGNYSNAGEAWIDFNQNQAFDVIESIGQSVGTPNAVPWFQIISFTFNVPPTAVVGNTRIRVIQQEGGSIPLDPCGSFNWGSVVDFSANIIVPAPTCPFPVNLAASAITSTSANLDWNESGTATVWNIEWGASGFSPGTGSQIGSDVGNTSQTTNLSGLSAGNSYDVYVQSDCGSGDLSFWAGPLTFNNEYCNFSINSTFPQHITSFITTGAVMDINNSSSGAGITSGGYSDFTSSYTLSAYETQNINFSMDGSFASPNWAISIYVDWNNDFIFDNSEKVYSPSIYVGLPITNSFSIPLGTAVGQYRMRVVGSYNSTSVSACGVNSGEAEDYFINIIAPPTCISPIQIDTINVTTTSVFLQWTELNSATSWEIEYGLSGFTQGTTAGTIISANSNPFDVTLLTPSTNYDFYILSNCIGGNQSAWRGPFSISTECDVVLAPFYESFNNGNLPNCWQNFSSNTGSNPNSFWKFSGNPDFGASNNGKAGGTFAWCDASAPNPVNTELVTPLIDISSLSNPELSFQWFSNNTGYPGDNIPLIIEVFDGINWNDLDTLKGDDFSWLNVYYDLSAYSGNTIQVRFRTNQTVPTNIAYLNDILLDEVRIAETITCFEPTNLAVTNISSNTAELSWTENNSATSWNIEYGPAGFTIGSGSSISGIGSNPYTLGGLASITTYDFYIQSACGPGDESLWAGPIQFTTQCGVVLSPWSEDFDNGGSIPFCWQQGTFNGENWNFDNVAPQNSHIGNNGVLNGTTTSGGFFAWVDDSSPHNIGTSLLSPMIDVSNLVEPMLAFYLISNNEGSTNVTFYADVWDGANWNIGVYTSSSNTVGGWQEINVPLNNLNITGDIQLRFAVDELNGSNNSDDVAIDDVRIFEGVCSSPTTLGVTNIDIHQADLNWTDNSFSTSWNIEYGITGFTQGNGTLQNVVSNPYTLSGLDINTTYDYYVQSDCGVNQSAWEGPFTFTTLCVLATGTDTQFACESFTWIDGITYQTDNNTATFTIPGGSLFGCDSIITLDLLIDDLNFAGPDNSVTICLNQPVDLDTLLGSIAQPGGLWLTPSGIPISGSVITSNVANVYDYSYEVSSFACPSSIATISITVEQACDYLSIKEESFNDISVFPNPVTNKLTILNPLNSTISKVEMLDMNGRIVFHESENLNNYSKATIEIGFLEKGIYSLRVHNSESYKVFKIVKQ